MNPSVIVVITEVPQLPRENSGTREGSVIQQLLNNGCDSGTCGTVLISLTSRMRRLAFYETQREEQPILTTYKGSVKCHKRRRLEHNGRTQQATRSHQPSAETGDDDG
jgi:hypothetical protein